MEQEETFLVFLTTMSKAFALLLCATTCWIFNFGKSYTLCVSVPACVRIRVNKALFPRRIACWYLDFRVSNLLSGTLRLAAILVLSWSFSGEKL